MDDLIIPEHALEQLQRDNLTDDDVYTVVGDYDDMIERTDGRTVYSRMLEDGRHVTVVIEDDGLTIVSAWVNKRLSRRIRR